MFRSGMNHEYLVKTYKGQTNNKLRFTVVNPNDKAGYDDIVSKVICGIKIEKETRRNYKIIIFNPKLIEDFNKAFDEYKRRLKTNVDSYRIHFIRRSKAINLDLMI